MRLVNRRVFYLILVVFVALCNALRKCYIQISKVRVDVGAGQSNGSGFNRLGVFREQLSERVLLANRERVERRN